MSQSNAPSNPPSNSPEHALPTSPHLQIYKLPITAIVSICNRASGVANSLAMALLVWVLYKASGSALGFEGTHSFVDSWFIRLVLFGFTFTLYFHLCNGIRHLFWDIGKGFEFDTAKKTAKASIAVAAGLTVITWLIAA